MSSKKCIVDKEDFTSDAQDFADTMRGNPKEIIAWAKREIGEYKKLIKILEKWE